VDGVLAIMQVRVASRASKLCSYGRCQMTPQLGVVAAIRESLNCTYRTRVSWFAVIRRETLGVPRR
jgi:hypothetical protein